MKHLSVGSNVDKERGNVDAVECSARIRLNPVDVSFPDHVQLKTFRSRELGRRFFSVTQKFSHGKNLSRKFQEKGSVLFGPRRLKPNISRRNSLAQICLRN